MKPALAPIPWSPLEFIPRGEAQELPCEEGWRQWDRAVIDLDAIKAQGEDERRAHQQRRARG